MTHASWVSDASLRWLAVLLSERFGVKLTLVAENGSVAISCAAIPGCIRVFTDFQFSARTLDGCANWSAASEGWDLPLGDSLPAPGLQQIEGHIIHPVGDGYFIRYDLLGLTYWMLTRREEVGCVHNDAHDRFPVTESHAYQHGYLLRPIVDEWLIVLRQVMRRLWPELRIIEPEFSISVSHDVDVPSLYGFSSLPRLLRHMGAALLKRGELREVIFAPWVRFATRQSLLKSDPMNTFDWLMNLSERNGLVSAFYFICGRTDSRRDADYELEHPAIRELLRRIYRRGHEIGLHPSYNTYLQPRALALEADRLRRVCAEEGIQQRTWGGRMHYLRWRHPITLGAWHDAGMNYDSTLGFAETPGFRCGTCFEYPAFDPVQGFGMELRIRPLVAMEVSVISSQYLGLGLGSAALDKFLEVKRACRSVGGNFTLLWHNSNLCAEQERALYVAVLESD